jgi:hypothetical protein
MTSEDSADSDSDDAAMSTLVGMAMVDAGIDSIGESILSEAADEGTGSTLVDSSPDDDVEGTKSTLVEEVWLVTKAAALDVADCPS